ncbi:hypothetical protein [Actinoplanes friuliensis]|uniref:Uncharacterized protein n=1 Tax=Actinoplanes friuliensis DSM 7358 TaxID=1246995 RepID=U5W460_9ACTN|nr:hypothetical protein [Actinoplanes friuliensis]AGZ43919.1 hypothetical protein AFR_28290 [Actinoplanes friuliensis DSM 7358]
MIETPHRSRTGLFIGLAAAALVVVVGAGVAVGVVVGGKDDGPAATGPKTAVLGQDSTSVRVDKRELDTLANDRSTALVKGDLDDFLAPLDPAATTMITKERQLFANLKKIKFARAQYAPFDQVGRTADRFGRAVTVNLDVAFVHQIDGFDTDPVEEWYRWTVVKKDAKAPLVITAIGPAPADAVSNSESVMYPAPWDKWPDMQVVKTEHTLFLVDKPMLGKTRKYAPVAETAARRVLADWKASGVDAPVFDRFVSSLVPTRAQLGSLYQVIKGETTEAGRMMPMSTYGSDRRVGGTRSLFDAGSGFFSGGDTAEIFRHEYAHAAVEALNANDNPDAGIWGPERWIIEGFAEYVANRGRPTVGIRGPSAAKLVRSDFKGTLPAAVAWDVPDSAVMNYHYYLGHQAFRFMAKKYGSNKVFEFTATYYRGGQSLDEVFQKVLGTSRSAFESQWASFVRTDARNH